MPWEREGRVCEGQITLHHRFAISYVKFLKVAQWYTHPRVVRVVVVVMVVVVWW